MKCFIKGATKLFFMHYSWVVIILFNTGLYKLPFSIDSFEKLAFCLSTFFIQSHHIVEKTNIKC